MCANCIAHQYTTCKFSGWGNKCDRCQTGRRPGCTFILSPEQRSRTQELMAMASRKSSSGKFLFVFFRNLSSNLSFIALPDALSQVQMNIAQYAATTALAVLARRQVLSAIDHVGAILHSVSGDGARLFPEYFASGSVIAACDILDLVEHSDFEDEKTALELLTSNFGPSIFSNIFKSAFAQERAELEDSPRAMDITPPPSSNILPTVESPQITPPPKRSRKSVAEQPVASSSRLAPPPFTIPEPMKTRTISQGEASTSSHHSSQGGSRSVSSKRKRQTRG